MLLANITVGKKILRHYPTLSLLRRHPAPAKQQFDPLVSAAAAVGFEIRIEDSKVRCCVALCCVRYVRCVVLCPLYALYAL